MPRIILDTDLSMGATNSDVDDGFALALAHADPNVTLEMITTVAGNTDVESATILTRALLRRLNITDLTVVKGASAPFMHPEIHRRVPDEVRALDDHSLPPVTAGYAPVEIVRRVMANPGQITIVAIGPLTNIATAMVLEPRLPASIVELVIMGGVFFHTMPDRNQPGEFNTWSDPEAAQAVLNSGAPQRWVGLDVTRKVRLTREHAHRMRGMTSSFAQFAGDATLAWIDYIRARNPGNPLDAHSCALHDPLAVAVLSRPDIVTFRDAAVSVVTGDHPHARGVMITDLLESINPPAPNCRVAESVDSEAFSEHFLSLLARL